MRNKWELYEQEKQCILRKARSQREYDVMISRLIKRLKI